MKTASNLPLCYFGTFKIAVLTNEDHVSLFAECEFNVEWCQDKTLAIKKFDVTTLAVQQQVSAIMKIVGLLGDHTIMVATTACSKILGTNHSGPSFSCKKRMKPFTS